MEHIATFEDRVPLTPKDTNRLAEETVETIILEKLRTKLENRCSRHGFVLPGSLEILSRSMGQVEMGRYTGDVVYQVQAQGRVLNPSDGSLVVGEILKKNKMGLYIEYRDAVHIILPRDLHRGDEEFENLNIGTRIQIEVKKSRFQVNDPFIQCVGVYKGLVNDEVVSDATGVVSDDADATDIAVPAIVASVPDAAAEVPLPEHTDEVDTNGS